ncbi:uncharacterized protein HRG_07281 [Hirsutella rhossiliensis]|uniref:Uncharacterized protein n=1 Tax=Hirsutella rhossiliensis TaxID=111463 RepID=A0A9P8SFR4_9HYPO|nr:uncharacterized protein HRG_07281 [Hirsutella rhossiliensis]KAH0961203.1 hypothetical protein HRG_07281 [Hirsutella rhossiliensis]
MFQEHFEGWNSALFGRIEPTIRAAFVNYLHPPQYTPYRTLPPRDVPNTPTNAQTLALFVKIWNKEDAYSGQPYDLLDDKIRNFLTTCRSVEVPESQLHAFLPRALTGRAKTYYDLYLDPDLTFAAAYRQLKQHFDTNVNLEHYHTDWSTITFNSVRSKHTGESNLRNAVIRACRGTPELKQALYKAPAHCEQLFADLRASIELAITDNGSTQWYTDRKYQQNRPPFRNNNSANPKRQPQRKKACFICGKAGCWSTKHTIEERKQSRMYFLNAHNASDTTPDFAMFLAEFEGHELDETPVPDYDTANEIDDEDPAIGSLFFTQSFLADYAVLHRLTKEDAYSAPQKAPAQQFLVDDRYTTRYQGIMLDTGQAGISFGDGPRIVSVADMDRLGLFFNNQTNEVVRDDIRVPAVRKWGHAWFHLARLHRLLRCAGHDDIDEQFTLRDDREFNFEITADVVQIGGKQVPIEAHNSIGKVEKAHGPPPRLRYPPSRVGARSSWREADGWTGPWIVIGNNGHEITINHVNGPHHNPTTTRSRPRRVDPNAPLTPIKMMPCPSNLSKKEVNHYDHAVQLRREGHITTPGAPFEQSDTQEINNLIAQGVFEFIRFDPVAHKGQRLFKARMVREVKGLGPTTRPPPTVQRQHSGYSSQLPLLAGEASVFLRDITQAYIQSKTPLNPESGLHWFVTYYRHHPAGFGMVAMQTDDTSSSPP